MNRSIAAAAALAVGFAIAMPALSWSADAPDQAQAPQQQTQPANPPVGHGPEGPPDMGMMHGRGGMGWYDGMGMGHGGWHHRMMMHAMMHLSPQQRCEERLARRAGIIAYTVAKLNLTPQQRPLWDKVRSALQTAGERQHQLCAALKPHDERQNETVLDRVNRREQFLSARLQALQQTQPALQQLYQALTPQQQQIINHPFHRDG